MAGEQIRLLVVEDVPQVASHVRSLLAAQSQIKMLDVVTAGERAVAAVSEYKPDVVIVDALLQGRVSGGDVALGVRLRGRALLAVERPGQDARRRKPESAVRVDRGP